MKHLKTLLVTGIIFSITSCSTSEKFTVHAPQGTKVYTPNNTYTPKGIAASDDRVNIEVPSNMYCGYILVQSPESGVRIPLGIDYTTKQHLGAKAARSIGLTLTGIGLPTMLTGVIGVAASDDETFGIITAIGSAAAGIGVAFGMPADARLSQTAYDYNFGYAKNQRISIPALSSTLLNPNPPKGSDGGSATRGSSSRRKASSGTVTASGSPVGSKVSKGRSDLARKIEGEYLGSGTLLFRKNVDERYSDISVVVERVDKNHVSVRILESGEDYFDAPLVYEINKNKKGGYTLKVKNLPEATIQVTAQGKMIFSHKKVNIDNRIYTLEIVAEKE